MNDDAPGPSRETLLNLRAMLPSFIKGLRDRKIVGKGKPILTPRPTKCCGICGSMHAEKMMRRDVEIQIVPEHCPRCLELLASHHTAFVCGDKFVFRETAPDLKDFDGQVIRVGPHVMDELEKRFSVQQRRKNNGNN